MADLDSRDKRSSSLGLPWSLVLPLADGSVDKADRQQSIGYYSGISVAGSSISIPVMMHHYMQLAGV